MLDHKDRETDSVSAARAYRDQIESDEGATPLFRARDICFYWDRDRNSESMKPENFLCAEFLNFIKQANPHSFTCTWGADLSGWCDSPEYSPEAMYGKLLEFDDLAQKEKIEILLEFCRILECSWARSMLAGYVNHLRLADENYDALDVTIRNQAGIRRVRQELNRYFDSTESHLS